MKCSLACMLVCLSFFIFQSFGFADEASPPASDSQPVFLDTSSKGAALAAKPETSLEKKEPSLPSKGLTEAFEKTRPKIEWSLTFGRLVWALITFFVAFYLIKSITKLLEVSAERSVNFRLTIMRSIPFVRIIGWTTILYFIIVAILAPPIETLLALTASAGIALGFASQDILKNIFGGIMILMDRPFQVGDKIQVGNHYGEVLQIGLRTVRIVTPDDSLVSIPNGDIVNQSVSNSNNGESNCQVVAELFLPVSLDLVQLKTIAYRSAIVSRYVYLNKPITIIIKNEVHEGRSLLKMRLKAYVLDIRYEFAFASEMTERVLQALIQKNMLTLQDIEFKIQ